MSSINFSCFSFSFCSLFVLQMLNALPGFLSRSPFTSKLFPTIQLNISCDLFQHTLFRFSQITFLQNIHFVKNRMSELFSWFFLNIFSQTFPLKMSRSIIPWQRIQFETSSRPFQVFESQSDLDRKEKWMIVNLASSISLPTFLSMSYLYAII